MEVYYGRPNFDNLPAMIDDLGVTVFAEDKTEVFPVPAMGLGSKIIVYRATPVEITDAKIAKIYRTWKETVKELLAENKIELLGQDSVSPAPETALSYNLKIKITRVAEVEISEKKPIDFRTIKKEDIDLEKGRTRVERRGVKGEKEIIYLVKRVDGEEVSRSVKETKVLKEPEAEILIIGIGPKYVYSGAYQDVLNAAARKYLINATALQCLMYRESGGSADAGYPDAQYKGLFQYEEGYWADASARAGFGGASIYNATAQIYTTAYELTHGQGRRWPPWSSCADR